MTEQLSDEAKMAVFEERLNDVKGDTTQILKILQGNNGQGLQTTVALHDQSINRMWKWLGGVSMAIIAGAIKFIFWGGTEP